MRLGADERGQAIQVGAIILFGFAVIAFAGYQAVSVPDQNQAVEFQHSLQVTDQMQEFRTDVIEAASTGSTRSQAFKLGTNYPTRLFAVNPPPASGRLTTTTFGGGEYVLEASGANLEDICGLSRDGDTTYDVPSKALVYEPNYNEYTQAPNVVYENTVTYRQFPGDVRLDSGQNLVDGKTLTLTPLVGDVDEATSATRTVDIAPGKAGIGATNATTVILTVPTALDAGTWEELLADEPQVDSVTNNTTTGGVDIELLSAEYTVICPPVGLGSAPSNTPADVLSRSGDGGTSLNPGDPGEVRLSAIERAPSNKDVIVVTFVNGGDEVNLSAAQFNFYDDPNGDGPERVDVFNHTDYQNDDPALIEDLVLRGATQSPSPTQVFAGSEEQTQVALEFEDSAGAVFNTAESDFAVLKMRFSDGQDSLYFIDMPKNSDTVGSTPTPSGTPTSGTMADQTILSSSGATGSGNSNLEFTFDNTGSTDVAIDRISLDSTDSGATEVQNSGAELTQDGSSRYDGTMQIDGTEYSLSPDATISAGTSSTFRLSTFEDETGSSVNVKNNDVTIAVYFTDGSQKSYTLTG